MSDPSVSVHLSGKDGLSSNEHHSITPGASTPTGEAPGIEPLAPTSGSTLPPASTSVPSTSSQKQIGSTVAAILQPGEEFVIKKRKLTSEVWNHMVKIRKDGQEWAMCNYCKARLKASSGKRTKSLHNHLNHCTKKSNMTIEASLECQTQIGIKTTNDGKIQFGNFIFDQEASRKELANAIIMHEYSLFIVKHVGFRRFVTSLQPLFKMVSRNTIKSDILKVYDIEKEKLGNWLSRTPARMAITTDMCTSNKKKGQIHFVDDNWKLQSQLLRFVYVPSPHMGEILAESIFDRLMCWKRKSPQ